MGDSVNPNTQVVLNQNWDWYQSYLTGLKNALQLKPVLSLHFGIYSGSSQYHRRML
jgi:hypothetical protein